MKQVVGRAFIGSETRATVISSHYDTFAGGGPSDTLAYLGRRGDRIVNFGERSEGRYSAYDPPATSYELPFRTGHRHSYEGTFGNDRVALCHVGA